MTLGVKATQRREQVLNCAAELFSEQGYHKTTVGHIVEHASIARGTFYLYFQDKRSIFDELLQRYMDDLRGAYTGIDVRLGPERCLELMRANVFGVFEVCLSQRQLTKILLSEAVGLDEAFDEKLVGFYAEVTDLLERTLGLGQALGIVPDGDVRIPAICVLGSIKELLYQVIMRGHEIDVGDAVDGLMTMYRNGLIAI